MRGRNIALQHLLRVLHALSSDHRTHSQVVLERAVHRSMLEDAGLKEHSVSFDAFLQEKGRNFAAMSFYHLLGREERLG